MDKSQFKLFLRFLKFILPYRRRYLAIIIFSGLSALLGLINPYLTKLVVDDALGKKDIKIFVILVLIGGGIFALNGLVDGLRQFLDRYIKLKVNFDLNKKVFRHIENLSFGWFQNKTTGEHIYKISSDIERVRDFITTTPPEAISIFPRLILIMGIVFYLNWKMALFSIFLAPFLYLPPYYFSRRMQRVWKALIENSQNIFDNLQEAFSHIQVVKAFGKETASIRKYLKKLINNIRIETRNIRLEILSTFAGEGVKKIIIGLIVFYGGYQVIKGQLTLGGLTAIMVYLRQLVAFQAHLAYFFQTTVLGLVSCKRVAEILDEKPQITEVKDAKKVLFKKGEVLFKDVSFGYRQGEYILEDLNFGIDGGSHIALVGPSGCGKTTIMLLLLRLYDPLRGQIFIDGYDIKNLKFSSLKEQIGIALQEPFLWNDTIENNIKYPKDATRDEIVRIAQLAGVDEFVKELPQGYRTIIGENACKLSEGQKQKIAIARALIKRPRILILDEAMSSMDSASEEKILLNIKGSQKRLTLITVSHRLSTVMSADPVYFFSRPNQMVIDSIQNLLDSKDFYELFAGQSKIEVETRLIR